MMSQEGFMFKTKLLSDLCWDMKQCDPWESVCTVIADIQQEAEDRITNITLQRRSSVFEVPLRTCWKSHHIIHP